MMLASISRRFSAGTAVLAVLMVSGCLTACAPRSDATLDAGPGSPEAPLSEEATGSESDTENQSGLAAMPFEGRDALPEGFPIEVPVVDGNVVVAELIGDAELGPWRYALEVEAPASHVRAWYVATFDTRSWETMHDAEEADGWGLVLRKGAGAWSTVRIVATDSGTRVEGWSGIGVPVPPDALPPSAQPGLEI